MKQFILSFIAVVLFATMTVNAQGNGLQITGVTTELVGEARGAAYNATSAEGIDTFSITVKVLMEDTATIAKLYFEMIDEGNNSVYISQEYNLQTNTMSGSRPNGMATLMGNECEAMLGYYWNVFSYKLKVKAQYTNGTFSAYSEY